MIIEKMEREKKQKVCYDLTSEFAANSQNSLPGGSSSELRQLPELVLAQN